MTPKEQIDAINEKEHDMVEKRYSTLNRSLLPLLEKNDIFLLKPTDLNEEQQDFIKNYFEDELYPVLTPMADDSSRPFPFISNNSLNLAIMLKNAENTGKLFATLRIPDVFSRIVRLPGENNDFILIEDIIKEYIGQLFAGFSVEETAVFRVIRDMDLDVAEKDSSDLLRNRKYDRGRFEETPDQNAESRQNCHLSHQWTDRSDVFEKVAASCFRTR